MTPIPPKLKKEILSDPTYKTCMLFGHHNHICEGRITLEHTIRYAGRQVQEKFAIISLCARGHEVDQFQDAGTMVKDMNEWVAYNRATSDDMKLIWKSNPEQRKKFLNHKYGPWAQKFPLDKSIAYLGTDKSAVAVDYPAISVDRTARPTKIFGGRVYIPVSHDLSNIENIKKHCLESEGIRYTDEKVISMAIAAYARELESISEMLK